MPGPLVTRYDITDLNDGRVAEFPVADPPGWDDVSLYYAKALQQMGWKNPPDPGSDVTALWKESDDPASYYFQASMHWNPRWPRTLAPPPYDERWNHCTHGPAHTEEFFLPWHRAYIYFFEVLIRAEVAKLGGPAGWAIPYWNYSFHDASDPNVPWPRACLPWVFVQETLPDGSPNPLFMPLEWRGLQPLEQGHTMYLEPLTPFYDVPYSFRDYASFNGHLDNAPHGAVHDDTGSGDGVTSSTGWMQSTVTASYDPIFWLHHSEIDRFWVGWLDAGGTNPDADGWLQATDDPNHDTRWNFWATNDLAAKLQVYPGDMLDPTALDGDRFPHRYTYANLPEVPAPRPPGRVRLTESLPAPPPLVTAEVAGPATTSADADIARTGGPVELGAEPVTATGKVTAEAPSALEALESDPASAPRVTLHLEDIRASGPPGNFEVYLNHTDADHETKGEVPHFVGLLSGFGVDHHDDHGMSAAFDITELVTYLRAQGEWDESDVSVTFVPAARRRAGRERVSSGMTVGSWRISSG